MDGVEDVAMMSISSAHSGVDGACMNHSEETTDGGHVGDISSTDVFEIAADLSSECAKIGNKYGQETVAKIVPSVVRLLEELEYCVDRTELLTAELVEAQHDVQLAKNERTLEVAFRKKVEEDYEQALVEWEDKHAKLEAKLNALQESSAENKKSPLSRGPTNKEGASKQDKTELAAALLQVETLEQEIHVKNLEETKQASESEALMQQVKRLASVNQALRRGQQTAKLRSQTLAEEKASLTKRCKELESRVQELSPADDKAESTHESSVPADTNDGSGGDEAMIRRVSSVDRAKELRYSREDMEQVLQERLEYKLRVEEVEEEMGELKESIGMEVDFNSMTVARPVETLPRGRTRQGSKLRGLFSQMSIDPDNPDEPQVIPF